jgi:CheY-like chemotaxis protein
MAVRFEQTGSGSIPRRLSDSAFPAYAAALLAVAFVLAASLLELGSIRQKARKMSLENAGNAASLLTETASTRCVGVFETLVRTSSGGSVLVPRDEVVDLLGIRSGLVFIPGADGEPLPPGFAGDSLVLRAISSAGGPASEMVEDDDGLLMRSSSWDGTSLSLVVQPLPQPALFLEQIEDGVILGLFGLGILVTFPGLILFQISGARRRRELRSFETGTAAPGASEAEASTGAGCDPVPALVDAIRQAGPAAPLVLLDEGGTVLALSESAAAMLDERPEDFIGEPFSSAGCFRPEAKPGLSFESLALMSGSETLTLLHSTGKELRVTLAASPVSFRQPARRLLLLGMQNSTELEVLKGERERLLEREMAVNSYAVLATMIRGFSHDLNNLLAGIIGAASLGEALHDENDPDRLRYQAVLAAAERAATISDELLHSASVTENASRPLDPQAELEEAAEALRSVLPRTISLEVSLGNDLPMIIADRALLRQILYNLALRSSGSLSGSGRIRFSVEDVPDPASDSRFLHSSGSLSGVHCICVSMSDGTILPPGLQRSLTGSDFDSYDIEKSYGAGMAAVHQAVRAMKGIISFSSDARGTILRMLFPAAEKPRDRRTGGRAVEGRGVSVLIAEEESIVRETTRQILDHYGFRTAEASSGDEAVEILEHQRFDALLLDLGTFGTPSLVVTRLARERWPKMAVLLTSGFEMPGELEETELDPGIGFLRKPYYPEALATEIKRLLASIGR